MKHFLFLLFLLPACASAQINWNQVFGKQRFQQGLGLPSTDTANYRTPVDTSAIVLNRADSTVYFRYKGAWKTLASGGAGTTPNLQQVLNVGFSASNKNINLTDVSSGSYTTQLQLNAINGGAENYLSIVRNDGNRSAYYSNLYAKIAAVNGSNPREIGIGMFESSSGVLDSYMSLKFASNPSGSFKFHKIYSGSSFNSDIFTQIPAVTGTLATEVQVNGIKYSANSSGLVDLGTISVDTASLSNRIENKQTDLDLLKLMGFTMKAETYGVTLAQMANQLLLTTNQICFYPFYWNVSDSVRGVSWFNRAASTSNQTNYNGIGIYTLSGGTLTRQTFTANDTTFWDCTANTWSSKPITPFYLAKGLYFIGYQFSGTGGTPPTIGSGDPLVIAGTGGPAFPPTEVNPNGVRFSTFITNATSTPPSSVAMSATSFRVGIPYFLFY